MIECVGFIELDQQDCFLHGPYFPETSALPDGRLQKQIWLLLLLTHLMGTFDAIMIYFHLEKDTSLCVWVCGGVRL